MSYNEARVMTHAPDSGNADELRLALTRIAGFIDNPIADVSITPETTATSPRLVTFQVRDRLNVAWKARWWVEIMVGTSEYDAGGTQTLTIVTGAVMVQIVPDVLVRCLTDANGVVALNVAAAAGTRYITASVVGRAQSSGAVSIT